MLKQADTFLPKTHIKDLQSLSKYECTICFDIEPIIMRCSGPCKASICLKCATSICRTRDFAVCPQRCSSPLRLEPIPQLQIQFYCPYKKEACSEKIDAHQKFIQHCSKCEHMNPQAFEEKKKKEKFACQLGHPLLFLDAENSIEIFDQISLESVTHQCTKCKETRICRSYCLECSTKGKHVAYCHDCRPLPCTKESCPIGHQFVKSQVQDNNLDCDLCGFCIYLFSDTYYHDQICNFGFCGPCYQTMPQYSPLIPLESNLIKAQAKKEQEGHEIKNGEGLDQSFIEEEESNNSQEEVHFEYDEEDEEEEDEEIDISSLNHSF